MALIKKTKTIIELGASKIVCMVGQKAPNKEIILGNAIVPYECSLEDLWKGNNFEQSLETAIKTAAHMAGIRIKAVCVSLPGCFCNVALNTAAIELQKESGEITQEDVERLKELAQRNTVPNGFEAVHCSVTLYRVDKRNTFEPVGMQGKTLSGCFSILFARKAFLNHIATVLAKQGISIEQYIATPLAIGLTAITEQERMEKPILIDSGYFTTDISVFQGDGIIFHDVVPMGGYDVTVALAKKLGIDFAQAEQLKKRYVYGLACDDNESYDVVRLKNGKAVQYPHAQVSEAIENANIDMLIAVKDKLDEAGIQVKRKTRFYFSGGAMCLNAGSKGFIESVVCCEIHFVRKARPGMGAADTSAANALLTFAMDDLPAEQNGLLDKIKFKL